MEVDVVIATKNQAQSLEKLLKQVVHQIPFRNLIIVYGSSRDNTKSIAEKYTDKVFWDEDKGLGAARALGIEKATSEIVVMIDSDVILTNEWYNKLINHFKDPKVAAVNGTCIYGYGCKPLESLWEHIRKKATVNVGCHNTMFRRKAVLQVGNFNKTIKGAGEDYELYHRLLAAGYKWLWVREATVYHPMSMFEFLEHVRWWTQGCAHKKELLDQISTTSFLRVYCRLAYSIPASFWEAVKLASLVHPALIFYYPLINLTQVLEDLRMLAKAYNDFYPFSRKNNFNGHNP
jgi:glycosyltransferase involved in cell wall biosynthesis